MGRYVNCKTCGDAIWKYAFGEQDSELEYLTKDVEMAGGSSDYHEGYFSLLDLGGITQLEKALENANKAGLRKHTIGLLDAIVRHYREKHMDGEMELFGEY